MRNAITSFAVIIALAACGDGGTGPNPNPDEGKLTIRGAAMGKRGQNIFVHRGEDPSDATVTVNGTLIPPTDVPGHFHGGLPNEVPVGGLLTLVVSDDELEATGTATLPSQPEITNVTGTRTSDNIAVQWTSPTSPDRFRVLVSYSIPGGSTALLTNVPGSARQASVSLANLHATATDLMVSVSAYNDGAFTGDAATTSSMNVRAMSEYVPLE